MTETVIEAGPLLEQQDEERKDPRAEMPVAEIEGARGAARLAGTRRTWPVGARTFFVVTGLVIAAIVSVLLLKSRSVREGSESRRREERARERVEKQVPALKLAAPTGMPAPKSLGASPSGSPGPSPEPQVPSEADVLQRRLSRGFGPSEAESGGKPAAPAAPAEAAPASPEAPVRGGAGRGGLEEKLEAVELKAASAGLLPDRDYLLTQGAMLDCVLETKVISTVAGMTSCHLTRDVYSTNGRVVLLDRGSRVVGRYQGGVQQGEARIFVVWTRVETPNGVAVELQSPGTGPLGEAGLGGWVDTHFWDRFGAAILLSIIQDGADAAAARAAGATQGTNITVANTTNAGKDVVAKSMEPTINIPPTLYKNQGERVGIFVARDLDFRSVYGLERGARAER